MKIAPCYNVIGGEAKRSQRTFDTELEQWGDWETAYFITSSVFGRVISEATATGKKRHTYVMGGGMEIARQFLSDSDVETVDFGITDPSGYSSRGSGGIMRPYKQEELDGLGNNVGTFVVPNRPEKIGNTMTPTQGVTFDDVTFGQCQLDGIMVPCSFISRSIEAIQMEIRDGATVIRKDLSGDLPGRATFTTLVVTETNIRMRDEKGNLIKNDDHGFREFWLDFHDVYIPEDTTGLPFHHPVNFGLPYGVSFKLNNQKDYENCVARELLAGIRRQADGIVKTHAGASLIAISSAGLIFGVRWGLKHVASSIRKGELILAASSAGDGGRLGMIGAPFYYAGLNLADDGVTILRLNPSRTRMAIRHCRLLFPKSG